MKLYATIRFKRPIVIDGRDGDDYLSFGGYEMVINGRKIPFDFITYYGNVDEEDNAIIYVEQVELDEDVTPPDTIEYLRNTPINITEITEFCCYTPNNNPLEILSIEKLKIVNNVGEYSVDNDVLDDAEITYTD